MNLDNLPARAPVVPDERPPSWARLLMSRAVRLVIVAELLVAIAVALGLWSLRRQTLDAEFRHLASLAGSMAMQTDATLGAAAAVLDATRDELLRGLLDSGSTGTGALLRARVAGLPRFRALMIIDARGRVLASSRADANAGVTFAQDVDFIAVRDGRPGRLYLGAPRRMPIDARQGVMVATDWRDPGGAFRGCSSWWPSRTSSGGRSRYSFRRPTRAWRSIAMTWRRSPALPGTSRPPWSRLRASERCGHRPSQRAPARSASPMARSAWRRHGACRTTDSWSSSRVAVNRRWPHGPNRRGWSAPSRPRRSS
ncbi:MAG: hypothetical protein R3E48_00175 [Burkholderiaceae bacterium]